MAAKHESFCAPCDSFLAKTPRLRFWARRGESSGVPISPAPRRHLITFAALAAVAAVAAREETPLPGRWMAGDFHQHSYFTDGSFMADTVLIKGFEYGLGWAANSEHGGAGWRDGQGRPWSESPAGTILGDPKTIERELEEDGAKVTKTFPAMWRWQSLTDFAYAIIQRVRREQPDKLAATGLEWNVPGHEHCSVGIVAEDAMPIGEFEYRFDRGDTDLSGGPNGVWKGKDPTLEGHSKAVAAVEWMQRNHPENGWIVFAHPERAASYTVADFRDFNDAGPDVAVGFEGLPGHQGSQQRGGYREGAVGGGTFGGAGAYIAKVGGVWDALLGEGRRWWTFVSSDFHSLNNDFWPGQYAKTWTWIPDLNRDGRSSLEEIPHGLRSGNTFAVHGDLIDALELRAGSKKQSAAMGETLRVRRGAKVELRIRFRVPERNHNGESPRVRLVQLIGGEVHAPASKFLSDGTTPNPEYARETNPTTRVLKLFTDSQIRRKGQGWYETPPFVIKNFRQDSYFRIRGSNLTPNTPLETDAGGNPLPDSLMEAESQSDKFDEAWRDLWFYSNPVFVRVQDSHGGR